MTDELPAGVPGIDVPRLAAWLSGALPDAGRISGIELIAGGRSNLTYRLDLTGGPGPGRPGGASCGGEAGRSVVVRRPPLGHVLPTAHDMKREHRVLSALADSAVPVPRPLAMCADEDVIGAPFYVMEHVKGRVLRTVEDAADVRPEQAQAISEQLVDVMADIHLLDIDAAGLSDFGRPEGYMARQLRRWGKQWEASHAAHLQALSDTAPADTVPTDTAPADSASAGAASITAAAAAAAGGVGAADYDRLFSRLAERLPDRPAAAPAGRSVAGSLVHGDFRLDNALIRLDPAPAIAAVVDWEMSTLGDPLADLGLTLVYWTESDDEERLSIPIGGAVTAAPGFGTGREFADRYAARTGFDLTDLDYYVAFGCFKLAVVLEGIHARFLQNATVGEGFDQVGESVPILVERAHRILDAGSPWPGKE